MKRTFAFLLTALMALSLTACGTDKNNTPNNSTPNQSATDNNTGSGTGSGAGSATGTAVVKNKDQRRIENGATGTAAGAADNAMLGLENDGVGAPESAIVNNGTRTGSGAIRSTTYEQMLRNARVHDRDGFLLDGENAVTPGAAFR
ncbi:hypothetical protein [Oscillibacter sp.]|uniref:LptM family lipoprotein n=1 Tax=Oscillibacter sp. TaxID=1945593 RepID=UPI00289B1F82|nr:hypothetical protein [Oscillibacter sp.]